MCDHKSFSANVQIDRHERDGALVGLEAILTVKCAECGEEMQFDPQTYLGSYGFQLRAPMLVARPAVQAVPEMAGDGVGAGEVAPAGDGGESAALWS